MDPYDYFARQPGAEADKCIAEFWKYFEENADKLDHIFNSKSPERLATVSDITEAVSQISPDLMWEFGPAEQGHTLAITAEWRDELRPLARAVVMAAPSLARWSFVDVRPAEQEFDNFVDNFAARFRTSLTVSDVRAQPGRGGRIDLAISGVGKDSKVSEQGLMIATELLGEQVERNWPGAIDTGTVKKAGFIQRLRGQTEQVDDFDPKAFLDHFRGAIAQAKSQLPDMPYSSIALNDRGTYLYQVQGMLQDHVRSDMMTYSTSNEKFANNLINMPQFSSQTHSIHGEWFCGVRIARSDDAPFDDVLERGKIEDALHNALSVDGVGGFVGGGHGSEAVYTDLALIDIETGLERIIDVVTKAGLAEHAQITFLDQGLGDFVIPCQTGKTVVH